MEDCRPLAYIEWGWIPHLRDFLYHINGRIIGVTEQPSIYRQNDAYIMDSRELEKFTIREQIYIHRCRLYLQVETLSDIGTVSGSHIHKSWFSATAEKPSRSVLRWPIQEAPGAMAWMAWKRFLLRLSSPTGKFKTNLGPWIRLNPTRRFQAYINKQDNSLWLQHGNSWTTHRYTKGFRKSIRYSALREPQHNIIPPNTLTPTEIIHSNDESITVAHPMLNSNILSLRHHGSELHPILCGTSWEKYRCC
jgi:hypothetical protein